MLTPRELQIAALRARNYTFAQIGTKLFITKKTVEINMRVINREIGFNYIPSESVLGREKKWQNLYERYLGTQTISDSKEKVKTS